VRMGSPARQSAIVATALLGWGILLGGSTSAQDAGPGPAGVPATEGRAGPYDGSAFDAGQETPAPPATPAPGPGTGPVAPHSSRFLLGDVFGLRPVLEESGLAVYVSSTQFEQGVAAGGFRQAFRWGGKFGMLAHLDSGKLGLWDGGTFDLFAESRLGQAIDG